MPNNQINPGVVQGLGSAFGGSPAAPVQQPSAPPPPSPGGSGGGSSLMDQIIGLIGSGPAQPQQAPPPGKNPFETFANTAVAPATLANGFKKANQ